MAAVSHALPLLVETRVLQTGTFNFLFFKKPLRFSQPLRFSLLHGFTFTDLNHRFGSSFTGEAKRGETVKEEPICMHSV